MNYHLFSIVVGGSFVYSLPISFMANEKKKLWWILINCSFQGCHKLRSNFEKSS